MNDGDDLLTNRHDGGDGDEYAERNDTQLVSSQHSQHFQPHRACLGSSRRQHQQQQHRHVYTDSNNSGKEAMVLQKLQGALIAVRRARDQEFRNRNMAKEKLRSAKEATRLTRNAVLEESAKLNKTTSESQEAIQAIHQMEGSIVKMKRKVRLRQTRKMSLHYLCLTFDFASCLFLLFIPLSNLNLASLQYEYKHEDLIHKRDKIIEYTRIADTKGRNQHKTLEMTQKLIEKQRDVYEKNDMKAARVTVSHLFSELKAAWASSTTGEMIEMPVQKRNEDLLLRDLQALDAQSSMLILPQMIEHKAVSMDAENKLIHAQISRLGSFLKQHRYTCYETRHAEQNGGSSACIPPSNVHASARSEERNAEKEIRLDAPTELSTKLVSVQVDGFSRPQDVDERIESSTEQETTEIEIVDIHHNDSSTSTFLDSAATANRENIDEEVDKFPKTTNEPAITFFQTSCRSPTSD
jgi:hypothetical protein